MPVNKRRHFSLRTVALFTCIVFSFTSVTEAAVNTAFNTQSSVLIPQSSSLIPSEYGRVEKYHQGTSDKTIIYIKDAHDSIEAQENIANMIHYLVEHQNVQTVYEEGYEGSVPSDKYFGSVEDPAVKKEVSYYLMDRLKIGGAEYAHINRTKDFYLIGADSRELHFENIRWYQKNTELSEETDRDLKQIYKELKRLASRHLPSPVRKWLKYKNRLDRQAMDLSDYLKRTFEFLGLPTSQIMTPVAEAYREAYPDLFRLLEAAMSTDREALKEAGDINIKDLYREMERLENEITSKFLTRKLERDILKYYKGIYLIYKLNRMKVTPSEFEAAKAYLKSVKTRELAEFIAQNAHRSVALTRFWEKNIETAVHFYETAEKRDLVIQNHLDNYLQNSQEQTAVVVYGGFHQENLESIFRNKGLSYYVITPGIRTLSPDHQQLYRRKMAEGDRPIRMPDDEARLISDFQKAELRPADAEAFHSEIRLLADIIRELNGPGGRETVDPVAIRQKLKARTVNAPRQTQSVQEPAHSELRLVDSDQPSLRPRRSWRNAELDFRQKYRQERIGHALKAFVYGLTVTASVWLAISLKLLDFSVTPVEIVWVVLGVLLNGLSLSLYTSVKELKVINNAIRQDQRQRALREADARAKRIAYDLRLPGHVETRRLNQAKRRDVLAALSRIEDRDADGSLNPLFVVSRENKVVLRIVPSRKQQKRGTVHIRNRRKQDKLITIFVDISSEESIYQDLMRAIPGLGREIEKFQSDVFYLLPEENFDEFEKRRELLGEFMNDEFFIARDPFLRLWVLVNTSLNIRIASPGFSYPRAPIVDPETEFDFNRFFKLDSFDGAALIFDQDLWEAGVSAAQFVQEAKEILSALLSSEKLDPELFTRYLKPLYDWMRKNPDQFRRAVETWYGPGYVIVLGDKQLSPETTSFQVLHERLHQRLEGKKEASLRDKAYQAFIQDEIYYTSILLAFKDTSYEYEAKNKNPEFANEFWTQLMHPSISDESVRILWQEVETLAESNKDVREMIALLKRLDAENRKHLPEDLRRLDEYHQYRRNRSEIRAEIRPAHPGERELISQGRIQTFDAGAQGHRVRIYQYLQGRQPEGWVIEMRDYQHYVVTPDDLKTLFEFYGAANVRLQANGILFDGSTHGLGADTAVSLDNQEMIEKALRSLSDQEPAVARLSGVGVGNMLEIEIDGHRHFVLTSTYEMADLQAILKSLGVRRIIQRNEEGFELTWPDGTEKFMLRDPAFMAVFLSQLAAKSELRRQTDGETGRRGDKASFARITLARLSFGGNHEPRLSNGAPEQAGIPVLFRSEARKRPLFGLPGDGDEADRPNSVLDQMTSDDDDFFMDDDLFLLFDGIKPDKQEDYLRILRDISEPFRNQITVPDRVEDVPGVVRAAESAVALVRPVADQKIRQLQTVMRNRQPVRRSLRHSLYAAMNAYAKNLLILQEFYLREGSDESALKMVNNQVQLMSVLGIFRGYLGDVGNAPLSERANARYALNDALQKISRWNHSRLMIKLTVNDPYIKPILAFKIAAGYGGLIRDHFYPATREEIENVIQVIQAGLGAGGRTSTEDRQRIYGEGDTWKEGYYTDQIQLMSDSARFLAKLGTEEHLRQAIEMIEKIAAVVQQPVVYAALKSDFKRALARQLGPDRRQEAEQLLQEAHELVLSYIHERIEPTYGPVVAAYWTRHEEAIWAEDQGDLARQMQTLESLNSDLDEDDTDAVQSLRPLAASDFAVALERSGNHDGAVQWMRITFQSIADLRKKGMISPGFSDLYEGADPSTLSTVKQLAAEILNHPAQWPDDEEMMRELAGMIIFAEASTARAMHAWTEGIDAYIEAGQSLKGKEHLLLAALDPFYDASTIKTAHVSLYLQKSLQDLEPVAVRMLSAQMTSRLQEEVNQLDHFKAYYMTSYAGGLLDGEFERMHLMFADILDAHLILNRYDPEKTMELVAGFYQDVNEALFGVQSASANYFMTFTNVLRSYWRSLDEEIEERYAEGIRRLLRAFEGKYAAVLSLKNPGANASVRMFVYRLLAELANLIDDDEMHLKFLQSTIQEFKTQHVIGSRNRDDLQIKVPAEPEAKKDFYKDVLPTAMKSLAEYNFALGWQGKEQTADAAFELWAVAMSAATNFLRQPDSSDPESVTHRDMKTIVAEAATESIIQLSYFDRVRMTAPQSPYREIVRRFLTVMLSDSTMQQEGDSDRYRVLVQLAWLLDDDQTLQTVAGEYWKDMLLPDEEEVSKRFTIAFNRYLRQWEVLNQLLYAVQQGKEVGATEDEIHGQIQKVHDGMSPLVERAAMDSGLASVYNSVQIYHSIVSGHPEEGRAIVDGMLPKVVPSEGYHFMLRLYGALLDEKDGNSERAAQGLHDALVSDPAMQREGGASQNDLQTLKIAHVAYLATVWPMPWRLTMAQLIMQRALEEPMPAEDLSLALKVAGLLHPQTVQEIMIEHLETVAKQPGLFQSDRDLRLIESVAAEAHEPGTRRRLYAVLDALKAEHSGLKKRFEGVQKELTKLFTGEDYLDIAKREYQIGAYDTALSAIRNGFQRLGKTPDAAIHQQLTTLEEEIQTVKAFADQAIQAYGEKDYEVASETAKDVLKMNPGDLAMPAVQSKADALLAARYYVSEGEWAGARNELEAYVKTHPQWADSHLQEHIQAIRTFEATLEALSFLLAQNRYQQAETVLNEALVSLQTAMGGIEINGEQEELENLREGISQARETTARLQTEINRRDLTVKQVYQTAIALAAYPEHRQEVFDRLLAQGFEIFNQAAAQSAEDVRRAYQRAFQLGRVVLEVATRYEPIFQPAPETANGRPGNGKKEKKTEKATPQIETGYLQKARVLISQSAANIWLPELKDDYFIVKGMDELAKLREKEQRQRLGLDPNAPIEFRFQHFEMKARSFVVSGFAADMLNSVRVHDNFMVSNIAENTLVPSAFKVIKRGTDFVELELPEIPESYEYIRDELERLFSPEAQTTGEEIGTLHHIRDSTWETQLAKTEPLVVALNQTTVQHLDPQNLPKMASVGAGYQAIDDMLGLRIKMPKFLEEKQKDEKQKEGERKKIAAWIREKEDAEEIRLDSEQKEALIEAAVGGSSYALFQGPPGTGKTTAIIWLVQILSGVANGRKPHVRVVAQQNEALDNIGRRILAKDIPFVRVGNADQKVAVDIMPIWIQKQELLEAMSQAKMTGESSLILGTGIGILNDNDLRSMVTLQDADVVILDEASRATAFEALTAVGGFTGVTKIFLVGDHRQLPAYGISEEDARQAIEELGQAGMLSIKDTPFGDRSVTVIFSKAKQERFRISLFEKVHQLFETDGGGFFQQTRPAFHFFNKQRRSGRKIVEISNFHYRDEQGNGLLEAKRDSEGVVEWIDTKSQSPEKQDVNKSYYNPGEVIEVIAKINGLLNGPRYRNRETGFDNLSANDIAVISPYNKQVDEIFSAVTDFAKIHEFVAHIIDTDRPSDYVEAGEILAILNRTDFTDSEDYLSLWLTKIAQLILPAEDNAYERAPSGQRQMAEERYVRRVKHRLEKLIENPNAETAEEVMELLGLPYEFIPIEDVEEGHFKVLTVDSSIGNEYQAVILSMVRSNSNGSVGFLGSPLDGENRINVGTSRAEDFLFIIGDKKTFRSASFRRQPIQMVRKWMAHVENVIGKSELRSQPLSDEEVERAVDRLIKQREEILRPWLRDFENSWVPERQKYGIGEGRETYRNAIQKIVRDVLEKHVPRDARMIDIGSGHGFLGSLLPEEWIVQGRYVPYDLNPQFLNEIRSRGLAQTTLEGQVYDMNTALKSEFPEGADVLLGMDSFDTFEELEKAIDEAYRVLKPGGKLIVFQSLRVDPNPFFFGSYAEGAFKQTGIQVSPTPPLEYFRDEETLRQFLRLYVRILHENDDDPQSPFRDQRLKVFAREHGLNMNLEIFLPRMKSLLEKKFNLLQDPVVSTRLAVNLGPQHTARMAEAVLSDDLTHLFDVYQLSHGQVSLGVGMRGVDAGLTVPDGYVVEDVTMLAFVAEKPIDASAAYADVPEEIPAVQTAQTLNILMVDTDNSLRETQKALSAAGYKVRRRSSFDEAGNDLADGFKPGVVIFSDGADEALKTGLLAQAGDAVALTASDLKEDAVAALHQRLQAPQADSDLEENLVIKRVQGSRSARMTYDKNFLAKIPADIVARIEEVISGYPGQDWQLRENEEFVGSQPDKRTLRIRLPEPVEIDGEWMDAIDVYGVLFKEEDLGKVYLGSTVANTNRTMAEATDQELADAVDLDIGEDGKPLMTPISFPQLKGMEWEEVHGRFYHSQITFRERGLKGPAGIGEAEFMDVTKNGEPLGAFITFVRKDTPKRLNTVIRNQMLAYVDDLRRESQAARASGAGNEAEILTRLSQQYDFEQYFEHYGREVRELVLPGDPAAYPVYPFDHHMGNIAVYPDFLEWHDTGLWKSDRDKNMPRAQAFGYVYYALAFAMSIVIRELAPGGGGFNILQQAGLIDLRKAFLRGFFYDQLENPLFSFDALQVDENNINNLDETLLDIRYRETPEVMKPLIERTDRPFVPLIRQMMGIDKSELRHQTESLAVDEPQATSGERQTAYSTVKDKLENLNAPVMLYVSYDDLVNQFTDEQREELFGMAYHNPEKIRIVIYGAEDTLHEKLKPFRQLRDESHNVWITTVEAMKAFENTQRDFIKDFDGMVSVHLSKQSRNLKTEFQGVSPEELRFLRYDEKDRGKGLAAAALLYALSEADGAFRMDFEPDLFGVLMIKSELRELVAQYESNIVVALSA